MSVKSLTFTLNLVVRLIYRAFGGFPKVCLKEAGTLKIKLHRPIFFC